VTDEFPGDPEKLTWAPSWVGSVEAYLGAVAVVIYFTVPFRRMALSTRIPFGITLLALGILFSLWGIRFGGRFARVVAWVSIIVLSEQAFVTVVVCWCGGTF
jgi:hypothetical protein